MEISKMLPLDIANHARILSYPKPVDQKPAAAGAGRPFIAIELGPHEEPHSHADSCPSYPRGSWLCVEGMAAAGVFIVHSGRVKETLSSADGKKLIVRVLGPGEMIGLASVLSGRNYESTAEALEPTHAQFVCSEDFLRTMNRSSQLSMAVAVQLGRNCREMHQHLRRITFPASVTQRVASLVQEWSSGSAAAAERDPLRFKVVLTQDEIAQMVGSTRETVSRVLADLRRKGWLRIKGVTWTVTNPESMKEMAEWGSASRL
jgi:CRP/FNR family transcriptional regulator, cyclic AMP receptor protein